MAPSTAGFETVEAEIIGNWGNGIISAQSGAGMSTLTYLFSDGMRFQPFHEVPWRGKDLPAELEIPPLLRYLRAGTWPCVPFGVPSQVQGLPSMYTKELDAGFAEPPHGPCSNEVWKVERTAAGIEMEIAYPQSHPIEGMRQAVTFSKTAPAALFRVEVMPREDCSLPIGLHPTFRVPAELVPGKFERGVTHPGDFEPGAYKLKRGTFFNSLNAVPAIADVVAGIPDVLDLTKLPLPFPCENLVELVNIDGTFTLIYRKEGFKVSLKWDHEVFPSCLLWMSNGGRNFEPWNSENYCLGIEPVRSDFDLGTMRCRGSNLTKQAGGSSCYDFKKGQRLVTEYSVTCEML